MASDESWSITGYDGRVVPSHFRSERESNARLEVFLPGFGYSTEAPLFHYSGAIVTSRGFDLLRIDYRYNENEEFQAASRENRRVWLEADVDGIYRSLVERSHYDQILFLGKSLGTMAMVSILGHELPWKKTAWVWLTPATPEGELPALLQERTVPSYVVIGSSDNFYRESDIEKLKALRHVETSVIAEADHSLELPNDVIRSTRLLPEILGGIDRFIARHLD